MSHKISCKYIDKELSMKLKLLKENVVAKKINNQEKNADKTVD